MTDRQAALRCLRLIRLALVVVPASVGAVLLFVPGCRRANDDSPRRPATSCAAPSRIVCFAPSSTEIIAALGCVDRLVGVGDFCQYPEAVTHLPRVGGLFDPNLELIMELAPDLVVVRGSNQSVEKMCSDRGIDVYNDPTERLEDVFAAIDELGVRLGCAASAANLKSRMRDELAEVQKAVHGAPRVRVLFVVGRRTADAPAGVTTIGPNTFINDLIRIAGGENVFGDVDADYPDVSLEAIIAAAPEVIIEAQPEAQAGDELTARVRETWQRLKTLPAVKADRIFVVTDDNVLIPSPRMAQTARRMAALLHPEIKID